MAPRMLSEQKPCVDHSFRNPEPHKPVKDMSIVERNSPPEEPIGNTSEVRDMLRKHQEQLQHRLNLFFAREEILAQQMLEMIIQADSQPAGLQGAHTPPPRPSDLEQSRAAVSNPPQEQKRRSKAARGSCKVDGKMFASEGESDGSGIISSNTSPDKKIFSLEYIDNMWTPRLSSKTDAVPSLQAETSLFNQSSTQQLEKQLETTSCFRRHAVHLVRNPWFDAFFLGVILVSALVMGVEVHLEAIGADENAINNCDAVQMCCGVFFMIELFIRICADRYAFFCSKHSWMWNWLDIILVFFSILELGLEIMRAVTKSDIVSAKTLGIARILRILRLTRIARTIRFVRALRVLLVSIISTLKTVAFALLLVLMVIYFYAIILTQVATAYHREFPSQLPAIAEHWGDLIKSMLTLFYCISGGLDWAYALDPLFRIRGVYGLVFITYIIVMFFAVLNAVTGAFCSGALESQVQDKELQLHDLVEGKKGELRKLATLIEKIFRSIDSDESGDIDMQEFVDNFQDETVQELLSTLELQPDDAWAFFRLLDKDKSGNLDMDKFIAACMQLRGPARSIDLSKIMHDQNVMRKQNVMFMKFVVEQLGRLRNDIAQQTMSGLGGLTPLNLNISKQPTFNTQGTDRSHALTSTPR